MRGNIEIQNKDMLTSNMIEKFAKRFENLSQTNQNAKETPKEPQKESLSKKISSLISNSNHKLRDVTTGKKVFSQKEAPQIRFFGRSQSSDNDEQNETLSDREKTQKESQVYIKNTESNNQNNRPKRFRPNFPGQKSEEKITKKQERQIKRNQNQLSVQQKQLFYLKLTKQMQQAATQSQKDQILRKRIKEINPKRSHKARTEFQGFKMLFDVRKQLESCSTKLNEKEISKKFAKKLIIYMQKNIHEKRYKFLTICRVGLRGLNLNHFLSTEWLNKLVTQNKHLLKGIDLAEYGCTKEEKPTQIMKKQIAKTKIQIASSESYQEASSSSSKGNSSQKSSEPKPEEKRQKQNNKDKEIQQKYIQNKELRLLLGVESKKGEKKDQPISKQIKNIEIAPKKISINQKKQINKQQNKTRAQRQESKQESFSKPQTPCEIFNKSSESSPKTSTKKIELTKQYPEQFLKKIATKIDTILKGVYKSIIKQQSKELCLQKDILVQIYQEYSEFQNTKLLEHLNKAPNIDHKMYQPPRNTENVISLLDRQPYFYQFMGKELCQNYNSSPSNYLSESKIERNSNDVHFPISGVQREEKLKIYDILKSELESLRMSKQSCTIDEIKQEAIKFVTSNPEVRRKISEEDLAQWLYVYQQQVQVKKYSEKVSNALEQISQTPRWKAQSKQLNEASLQVSQQFKIQNDKYVADEFAKKMMMLYKKN